MIGAICLKQTSNFRYMRTGHGNTDSEFGHHYTLNGSGSVPVEDKEKVCSLLKEWMKLQLGREKDLEDIRLIDEFLDT